MHNQTPHSLCTFILLQFGGGFVSSFVLLKGMVFFFVFVFRMLCSFIEDFVCLFVFDKT